MTLKNNSLQEQPDNGTLLAVLLDENGGRLETQTVTENTGLTCEQTKSVSVPFTQLGSDVILLYAPGNGTGLQALQFSGMDVDLGDFAATDPEKPNEYTYTLPADAPASTVVTFISSEAVTVNGTEYDKAGSAEVTIPTGSSTITVTTGGNTYILNLSRSSGGSSGGGGSTRYAVSVPDDIANGTVTVSRTRASRGQTVIITAQPDESYQVGSVTVTRADGTTVEVNRRDDGTYTFTMPASRVTVEVTFVPEGAWVNPFWDVSVGDWFYDAAAYVHQNGLMSGTSADTFEPNANLTRAMMATVLWATEGSPVADYRMDYDDVSAGDWYAEAVRWATSEGVVSGVGGGRFDPNSPITREQMAVMLYAYTIYKGYDIDQDGKAAQEFNDYSDISDWAVAAMEWAVNAGMIGGKPGNILDPGGYATRAEVATILRNYHRTFVK